MIDTVEKAISVAERGTIAVMSVVILGLVTALVILWRSFRERIKELESDLKEEHKARLADARDTTKALLEAHREVNKTVETLAEWHKTIENLIEELRIWDQRQPRQYRPNLPSR